MLIYSVEIWPITIYDKLQNNVVVPTWYIMYSYYVFQKLLT